jgi:hypothetical protein
MAAGDTSPRLCRRGGRAGTSRQAEVWVAQQFAGFRQSVGIDDPETLAKFAPISSRPLGCRSKVPTAESHGGQYHRLFALGNIDVTTEAEGRPMLEGFNGRMSDPWMRHFLADNPGEASIR